MISIFFLGFVFLVLIVNKRNSNKKANLIENDIVWES